MQQWDDGGLTGLRRVPAMAFVRMTLRECPDRSRVAFALANSSMKWSIPLGLQKGLDLSWEKMRKSTGGGGEDEKTKRAGARLAREPDESALAAHRAFAAQRHCRGTPRAGLEAAAGPANRSRLWREPRHRAPRARRVGAGRAVAHRAWQRHFRQRGRARPLQVGR